MKQTTACLLQPFIFVWVTVNSEKIGQKRVEALGLRIGASHVMFVYNSLYR